MAANDQYRPGQSKFFSALPEGTGAPGSEGVDASATAGPVIATPRILSSPYSSSQVPGNFSTVAVTAGDTSSMSSDAPTPAGGDPLTGVPQSFLTQTGAGDGNPDPYRHPNAGGGS